MRGTEAANTTDIARGYLLIAVFYVHALYGVYSSFPDPALAMASGVQLKLLAPNVSAFFFLSGMASRNIKRKGWRAMLRHSLMLLLLTISSHMVGAVFDQLCNDRKPAEVFLRALAKPIVYGTGYSNYVSWFFLVLAVARIFAWLFETSKARFIVAVVVAVALVRMTQILHFPDNLYEWRNWPTATLFFLCGMRLPEGDRLPGCVGLGALPLSLAIGWLNRPGLLTSPFCPMCDLAFVGQPMVGAYGFLPAYIVQQILFILFLLWVSSFSKDKLPGPVAQYFGQLSLPMLVLHGWVIITLYPFGSRGLPDHESGFLFVAILSSLIVVHAVLFELFRPVLERFIAWNFTISGWMIRPRAR